MKKTMMFLGMLSLGLAHAQQGRNHPQHNTPEKRVGINTTKPMATLEISKTNVRAGQVEGFLLPHLTQTERNAMTQGALVNGLMIFNTTKNCIDWWDGNHWQCTDGSKKDQHGNTVITGTLSIQVVGFEGNYTAGTPFNSNNKVKFTLTNNGSTPMNNVDLSNILQVQNPGGSVSVSPNQNSSVNIGVGQSVTLAYILSGTPAQGTLTATMSYNGASQTATQQVNAASNPLSQVSVTHQSFAGTYTAGTVFTSGNTVTFRLVNNSSQNVTLPILNNAVTVTNGSANITATGTNTSSTITLNPGEGYNAIYRLSGTPTQGQLTATFNAPWGATANGSTQVNANTPPPPTSTQNPITGSVVLAGKTHYITSIKDSEYIPFVKQPAAWETGETNGNDPLIDVQGTITTQGIDVLIPVSGTGNVGAYKQEITVTAEKSKNGQAGVLILEWEPQYINSNVTHIGAKLKAKNNDFHIKQLDVAKGLGNDYKGLVLAEFTYKKDNTNTATEKFIVKALSGIPDRMFDVPRNSDGKLLFQFIYLPIKGPDGKWWLNNNLGAEYANINSPYFSPSRQAGALDYTNTNINAPALANPTADQIKKDFRAYGYMYVWGVPVTGREVTLWRSSTEGTMPKEGHFPGYKDLLNQYTEENPCPEGYHLPSKEEFEALDLAIGQGANLWTNDRILRLPASGSYRVGTDQTPYEIKPNSSAGRGSQYLSRSRGQVDKVWTLTFNSTAGGVAPDAFHDASMPVRCIAD